MESPPPEFSQAGDPTWCVMDDCDEESAEGCSRCRCRCHRHCREFCGPDCPNPRF